MLDNQQMLTKTGKQSNNCKLHFHLPCVCKLEDKIKIEAVVWNLMCRYADSDKLKYRFSALFSNNTVISISKGKKNFNFLFSWAISLLKGNI